MSDIKWLPDGQKMFDKLMSAVPDAMRDAIRPKLEQMTRGKVAGQPVSESGEKVRIRRPSRAPAQRSRAALA